MKVFHLVARAYRRDVSLTEAPLSGDLWSALRHAFPNALAAVLMPDHLHVLAWSETALEARARLAAILSGARRHRAGHGLRWEPTPMPNEIVDTKHLRRQIRYVSLNPCRSRLARDPLEWVWSTHRDIVGAVVDPWISAARLARVLSESPAGFAARWHAYVSGDPAVVVGGTPFPHPSRPASVATHSLGRILAATAAAHRVPIVRLAQRGPARGTFFALARASGWRDVSALARAVSVSRKTAWRHHRSVSDAHAAAWLCLGDARLLTGANSSPPPAGRIQWPSDERAIDYEPPP